jgi:hypothetical protein
MPEEVKGKSMRDIWDIAWHRFNVILSVVADTNARAIAVFFYFTILVPFGLGSRFASDPLRQQRITDGGGKQRPAGQEWLEREPVPTDIDSARQQG